MSTKQQQWKTVGDNDINETVFHNLFKAVLKSVLSFSTVLWLWKSTVVQLGFVHHFIYFTGVPICLLNSHNLLIHLFTITALSCQGWQRARVYSSWFTVKVGHTWTGHRSITEQTQRDTQTFTPTFTPTAHLEAPLYLSMSSDCGRKLEHLQKTHTDTRRTCRLHTETTQLNNKFEPTGNNAATVPLFHPKYYSSEG